jgi:general secretion pathway protein F
MAQYEVSGTDKMGKTMRIYVESDSNRNARLEAKKRGMIPLEVRMSDGKEMAKQKEAPSGFSSMGGLSASEISSLTRQIATLVKSHVPIVESLSALVDQTEKIKTKKVLMAIRQSVKEGKSLGDSFAQFPKLFNRVYVNMVRAGESSGRLDVVLMRLADFYENQLKQKQKVQGALAYPIIIMIVALIALIVIFTFVIPNITKVFDSLNQAMPLSTRILIGASEFVKKYLWPMAIGGLAVLVFTERFISTEKGRDTKDRTLLKLPVIGDLVRLVSVSRFSRTLGTLLKSGVPMLTSLQIAKNVVNHTVFERSIDTVAIAVEEGRSLSLSLKQTGEFPPIVIHMVGVGEKSGELEDMLMNIAENYDREVDSSMEIMTSVLSPIMIIGMVCFVGFIMMAVLGPLMKLNQFAQ